MPAPRPRTARTPGLLTVLTMVLLPLAMPVTPAMAVSGPETAAGQLAAVVKLTIGDEDRARACTGTLIHQLWVLTAASCFAATPGTPVPAGRPALKATAALSDGTTADILEIVPRDDRDLALIRLVTPVTTVRPAIRALGLPAVNTDLTAAGFGRTRTEWVPDKLRSGTFTLDASTPTGLGITGKGTDVLCKGDTGGPLMNADGLIVGVNSRSWQGGCLGSPAAETRTSALSVRVDDLASWFQQTQTADWKGPLVNANSGKCLEIENSLRTDGARVQQWTCRDMPTMRWNLHWAGNGWEVRNVNSGICLEIEDSQMTDGARAQQWTCHDVPTMRWDLVKGKWGYWLKNRNSGKCLEIEDSQMIDGARAQQWTCHDMPTLEWTFTS
ncbi:RICIN domain-containing protein [Streptomyces sp. NPDC085540]|uniref:RICIN domain-containing protein n=1 Tax=Streptomyces sp. NPDC085540 TaxID=3365730 RepID=UPI0037D2D8FB